MPLTGPAASRSWSTQAIGWASLVVGVLSLPLPGLGVDERRGSSGWDGASAAVNGLLAQQPSSSASFIAELQELIRQADALEAKGAYTQAEPLRLQILTIHEKVLGNLWATGV